MEDIRNMQRIHSNHFIKKLIEAANWVISVTGSAIFAVLIGFSLIHTQYMIPGGSETPLNRSDSLLSNVSVLVLVLLLIFFLYRAEKKMPENIKRILARVSVIIAMLWTAVVGFWWITTVNRIPEGDQAYLYGGASYFLEGQYVFLEKGGYLDMCPHQLNLVFLMELLFLVVGTYNYFAFQVICVLSTVGIVLLGYLLIRQMTDKSMPTITYCILIACCLPMFFYTGWVYGDIPSVFWVLAAANLLAAYEKKKRWGYLIGIIISLVLAIMVRQNSLIFLIALCLAGFVHFLKTMDRKLLVTLVLAIACPLLITAGVNKMYELRSGIPHSNGMSSYSYIAMGLQEQNGMCGWHSLYCKEVYYAADYDSDLAGEISKQDIRNRMAEFAANPIYTVQFFGKKILTQWNAPLYQCLFFSNRYAEGTEPASDSLVAKISNEFFDDVLEFCNYLQLIIYVGTFCYFLFAVKKDSNTIRHFVAICILGGFFFTIIWEAKSRYTLPYYLLMFPLAVIGYQCFFEWSITRFLDSPIRKQI